MCTNKILLASFILLPTIVSCTLNRSGGSQQLNSETPIPPSGLVGGNETMPGQFPATVGLLIQNPGPSVDYLTCTMTKIADRIFLTAAHCFFPRGGQDGKQSVRAPLEKGAEIAIHFGVDFQNGPLPVESTRGMRTLAKIVDYKIHPTWFKKVKPDENFIEGVGTEIVPHDQDFAMMKIDADTPHIKIAQINLSTLTAHTKVVMAGYGCTYFDHGVTGNLLFLNANVESKSGTQTKISSGNTTSPESGSICPGDSGGALFLAEDSSNLTIVGINSRFQSGELLGRQLSPNTSYFTRFDDEDGTGRKFIEKAMKQLGSQLSLKP